MLRISVVISVVTLLLAGCVLPPPGPRGRIAIGAPPVYAPAPVVKTAPPAHAKAYGYRSQYRYNYYPDAQIYFDSGRGLYFYLQDGRWSMSASLPSHLGIYLGGAKVAIDMDVDRPYLRFDEHRRKYPGRKNGHHKEEHKERHKGKNKKKKKWDDD